MDNRVLHPTCIRFMNVGGYRHNYEGLNEKTSYQMFINRGRTTTNEGSHASLVGILSFFSFFLGEEL